MDCRNRRKKNTFVDDPCKLLANCNLLQYRNAVNAALLLICAVVYSFVWAQRTLSTLQSRKLTRFQFSQHPQFWLLRQWIDNVCYGDVDVVRSACSATFPPAFWRSRNAACHHSTTAPQLMLEQHQRTPKMLPAQHRTCIVMHWMCMCSYACVSDHRTTNRTHRAGCQKKQQQQKHIMRKRNIAPTHTQKTARCVQHSELASSSSLSSSLSSPFFTSFSLSVSSSAGVRNACERS